jgi:hypothetical protein
MREYRHFFALLCVTAGCSRDAAPTGQPSYDSDRARTTLVQALDAWKKGEARALSGHKPPIRFVDDDLTSGLRLVDYALEEPDAPIGAYKDVPVILSLRDARGRAVRREARYQVATEPACAVLRSDR